MPEPWKGSQGHDREAARPCSREALPYGLASSRPGEFPRPRGR